MQDLKIISELLGADNIKELKRNVANIIIDAIQKDIEEFQKENYIIDMDELLDFVTSCKKDALENIKKDYIKILEKQIKNKLGGIVEN